jgi:RNase P/RNase MRP subunit p30
VAFLRETIINFQGIWGAGLIDIVFPRNNENLFIELAEALHLKGLCFAYQKPTDISRFKDKTKIGISSAVLCSPEDVRKYKGKALTLVRAPQDQTKIRNLIESVRPDILFDLEFSRKKDFMHHRASGMNHVLADIARQKKVSIAFNFSGVLDAKPKERAVYIGRTMQNIRFARKFGFMNIIASFADSPWKMRPRNELISFYTALGMTAKEAAYALDWVGRK